VPRPLYPIDSLLPHARPMILLDRVVERQADAIVTELEIRPGLPFFRTGQGIAAHIALEWMAQACGAHVGAVARDSGGEVRVGFLLGTREFKSSRDWFVAGETVLVGARLVFHEGETAVFDCWVMPAGHSSGEAIASAQLTVYQPADVAAMLASQGIGAAGPQGAGS